MSNRENYVAYQVDPSNLVNLDYIDSLVQPKRTMVMAWSAQALKKELFDYLRPHGLRDRLMLFMQPAQDLDPRIHTDYINKETTHYFSFNILCHGQGKMVWYQRPEQGSELYAHPNSPNHIFYEIYPGLDLPIVDEWSKEKTALVRTDIPHGVINNNDEFRVCLSIRINNVGWQEAKNLFENYFLMYELNSSRA